MLVSFAMIFLFILGTVSASEGFDSSFENNLSLSDNDSFEDVGISGEEPSVVQNNGFENIDAVFDSGDTNVVSGERFGVKLSDKSGAGISNKTVRFTFNGLDSNSTTDVDGFAYLNIKASPGNYVVRYSFNETGFNPIAGQTEIFVISTHTSSIDASNYVAYVGVKNTFEVVLKAGSTLLEGRWVKFTVNGKNYNVKTNSRGEASLNINLKKGTYEIGYSYEGENNIDRTRGKSKITVKKGMPTKIVKANSIIYRHKTKAPFKIKLLDSRGNPIAGKKVVFKLNKKKYARKTNSKGVATLNINLKANIYKIKVSFSKDSAYKKSSKTFKVKVKTKKARNNGIWLLALDMKKVNFTFLKNYGTKHIFLNAKALERFGKDYVETFIANAKANGIKVHIWMQVFYNGGKWQSPVKNGKIKYDLINSKVKLAKSYAKLKDVGGVHFDYMRFPSDASSHKNGMKAISYFAKKASKAVHGINSKIIVSAAIMPEPSAMKSAYGQDIKTISKHLDVIIPMVYKGNYHAGYKWIKKVTSTFVKQSKKAKIWTGIQTYKSDSNAKKLSASEIMNDADFAAYGGAYGVILFRYGMINYINFNNV